MQVKLLPSARSNATPALLATGLVLAFGCPAGAAHAAFPSANGRIAYSEYLSQGGTDTQVELRTVRPDGRRNRLLLQAAYEPAYSPKGRRLAYSDEIVSSLVVARADGRGIRGLTPGLRGDQEAADGTPDWAMVRSILSRYQLRSRRFRRCLPNHFTSSSKLSVIWRKAILTKW